MSGRFLFPIILFLSFCSSKNKSIDIYSYQTKSKGEKLRILKDYVRLDPGLRDAEYHIWYQDNSDGWIPGPSDYNLTLALKITPDSIDHWLKGLSRSTTEITHAPWQKLKLDSSWNFTSAPEYYGAEQENGAKIVYRDEGIILALYSTN